MMRYRANPREWGILYLRQHPNFIRDHVDPDHDYWSGVEIIHTGYPELIPEFESMMRMWFGDDYIEYLERLRDEDG